MKYKVIRTDTADSQIRQIILFIAEGFGKEVALKKLDELEQSMMSLADHPYKGVFPRDRMLKRQGYRVLILEKNLVFYKTSDEERVITIHAVFDQRRDYLSILRGL